MWHKMGTGETMNVEPAWVSVGLAVLGIIVVPLILWAAGVFRMAHDWPEFKKKVETDVDNLKGEVNRTAGSFDTLLKLLPMVLPKSGLVVADSPLRLTERGKGLAKSMDAYEWASKIAAGLLPQIAGQEEYEINRFSEQYVENDLDKDRRNWIARHAYEFGLPEVDIRTVLSVVLRDELIKRAEPANSP